MKSKLINFLLLPASLFAVCLFLELCLIFRFDVLGGGLKQSKYPSWVESDDLLMWKTKANLNFHYQQENYDGTFYPVDYQTFEYGFRQWGNLNTDRKKVLVIGDSITQALEVSNDKTYYSILGKQLNLEVFAFGVSAYNSVQEWQALKKFLPLIKPDFVLWQFCHNDLYSNDARTPSRIGFIHNPSGKLPYWDVAQKEVVYHSQNPWILWLAQTKVNTQSRLLFFVSSRLLSLVIPSRQAYEKVSEERLSIGKEGTESLFREIKKTLNGTPLYLFSNNEIGINGSTLKAIAEENGFVFIQGIQDGLENGANNSQSIYAPDQIHWNETGHQIVAAVLANALKDAVRV